MFPSSFIRFTLELDSPACAANWLMVSHWGAVVIICSSFCFNHLRYTVPVVYHSGMTLRKTVSRDGADFFIDTVDGPNGSITIELKIVCSAQHPTGITTSMLRSITSRDLRTPKEPKRKSGHDQASSKPLSWQPGSRTILNNDELRLVANVYISALQSGDAPTKAVQEWATTSRPTASRWIKQARTLGLIGTPTKPGLPGNNNRKGPLPKEK